MKDIKSKCEEEKDSEFKVKYIIQIDYDKRYGNSHEKVSDDDIKTAKEYGVELIGLSEVLAKGKEKREEYEGKKLPTKGILHILCTHLEQQEIQKVFNLLMIISILHETLNLRKV